LIIAAEPPHESTDSLIIPHNPRHEAIAKALSDAGYNVIQTPHGKMIIPAVDALQVSA